MIVRAYAAGSSIAPSRRGEMAQPALMAISLGFPILFAATGIAMACTVALWDWHSGSAVLRPCCCRCHCCRTTSVGGRWRRASNRVFKTG